MPGQHAARDWVIAGTVVLGCAAWLLHAARHSRFINFDFHVFYVAGQLWNAGLDPYDGVLFAEIQLGRLILERGEAATAVTHLAEVKSQAASLGQLTSRTFELEPGVCALVTVNWDEPLSTREFYEAFLDIARTLGYVVSEQGLVTKISLPPETPRDPRPACRRYPVRQ